MSTLRSDVFESLLSKLIAILEQTQNPEGPAHPQARQALLQATNEFKIAMAQAREVANGMSGGELAIDEQLEVIEMLQQLRDLKKRQLEDFSDKDMSSSKAASGRLVQDVDSTASTPMGQ